MTTKDKITYIALQCVAGLVIGLLWSGMLGVMVYLGLEL